MLHQTSRWLGRIATILNIATETTSNIWHATCPTYKSAAKTYKNRYWSTKRGAPKGEVHGSRPSSYTVIYHFSRVKSSMLKKPSCHYLICQHIQKDASGLYTIVQLGAREGGRLEKMMPVLQYMQILHWNNKPSINATKKTT